ncbi:MAG: DUF6266 family protein [Bacteroidia bacterium]
MGYRLNGQDIIKGLPKKRTKKPTEGELVNRKKFAQMQAWLQPLLPLLKIGFKGYAPTFQGFVVAKSYNSKHAFVNHEDGTTSIDPALALVSFGSLALPKTMNMELANRDIVITWSTEGDRALDLAMILAYVVETGETEIDLAAGKRKDGKAVLKLPSDFEGGDVHVYIAFVGYDHNESSNSYYLGSVNV